MAVNDLIEPSHRIPHRCTFDSQRPWNARTALPWFPTVMNHNPAARTKEKILLPRTQRRLNPTAFLDSGFVKSRGFPPFAVLIRFEAPPSGSFASPSRNELTVVPDRVRSGWRRCVQSPKCHTRFFFCLGSTASRIALDILISSHAAPQM